MKNIFRVLLICLALVMCLTPVLVACDSAKDDTDGGSSSVTEGRKAAKYTHMDKSCYVVLYQNEEAAGKDTVKCSLVVHKAADDSVVDSISFDLKLGGADATVLNFKTATWTSDNVQAIVVDCDGNSYTYELKIK